MCREIVHHPGTRCAWKWMTPSFPDRYVFISDEKVQFEDFASPRVRCIWPWILFVEHLPHTNTISAGSLLSAPLIKDIKHKLKNVGADTIILQGWSHRFSTSIIDHFMPYLGYGMTELSPASHMMPHDQALLKAGSVGVLLPNLEARLVGDDGVDVEQGGCGELWLRGPIVMKVCLQHDQLLGTPDST